MFEPTTLRRAVALIEQEGLEHLAALPDVRVPGLALNAFVAACGVFFFLYTRPWKARNARSWHHIGVGAFNLIRAGAYRAIGTHDAIAMRPDDDIKLGKLVKKRGLRQDVVYARDLVTVEWYSSLGKLIDGLMKNAFAGVNYSLVAVAVSTTALFLIYVWPSSPPTAPHVRSTARAFYSSVHLLDQRSVSWRASRIRAGLSSGSAALCLHPLALGAARRRSWRRGVARECVSACAHSGQPGLTIGELALKPADERVAVPNPNCAW